MKRVLLTGINGTVAQVMKKELDTKYDMSGLSILLMDGLLEEGKSTWKELLDAYRARVSEQLPAACRGVDAVVHLAAAAQNLRKMAKIFPLQHLATA